MVVLTEEEKKKEQERRHKEQEDANSLATANYYAESRQFNLGDWKKIAGPGDPPDPDPNGVNLSTQAHNIKKLLTPGVYATDPPGEFNIRLDETKDGKVSVRAIPPPMTDAGFKKANSAAIDFMVESQGINTLVIDWDSKDFVTKDRLNDLLELAASKNLSVEFGPAVQGFLDGLSPKEAKVYYDAQKALENNCVNHDNLLASANNFKNTIEDLSKEEKLTGDAASNKAELNRPLEAVPGASDLTKLKAAEKEIDALTDRLKQVQNARAELSAQVAAANDIALDPSKYVESQKLDLPKGIADKLFDKVASMLGKDTDVKSNAIENAPGALVRKLDDYYKDNDNNRADLLARIDEEHKDIEKRLDAWQSIINDKKPGADAATTKKIDELDKKLKNNRDGLTQEKELVNGKMDPATGRPEEKVNPTTGAPEVTEAGKSLATKMKDAQGKINDSKAMTPAPAPRANNP